MGISSITGSNHNQIMKIVRFIISGGTGAATDLLLLYVLVDVFGVWYLASAAIAFIISQIVSFMLQKHWTFGDMTRGRMHKQAMAYLSLGLINLGVNSLFMYILVDKIEVHYLLAQAISSAIIAIYSYIVYSHIFKVKIEPRDTITP